MYINMNRRMNNIEYQIFHLIYLKNIMRKNFLIYKVILDNTSINNYKKILEWQIIERHTVPVASNATFPRMRHILFFFFISSTSLSYSLWRDLFTYSLIFRGNMQKCKNMRLVAPAPATDFLVSRGGAAAGDRIDRRLYSRPLLAPGTES